MYSLHIYSCSDNGTIVIHSLAGDSEKDNVIHLNEPLKAVCIEDDYNNTKRERSFVVGEYSVFLTC